MAPGIDVAKIAAIGETVIIRREGPESSVLAAGVAAVVVVAIIRAAVGSKIVEEVVVGVRIAANAVAQGTALGEPMQRIRKNNCRRACVTKSS